MLNYKLIRKINSCGRKKFAWKRLSTIYSNLNWIVYILVTQTFWIYFCSFNLSIRSSMSRKDLIFVSCTSFIIISRAPSDPFRNCDDISSAYWIHTQLAQPDIQQLVGGDGIYSHPNVNEIKTLIWTWKLRTKVKSSVYLFIWSICRCFCFVRVTIIRWAIVWKSNTLHANWSAVNCIL